MKDKKLTTVLVLGMLAALFGGIMLVGQSQETRKGAFYGGVTASLWPNPKNVSEGDTFDIYLKINPKPEGATEAYLISGVDLVLGFDKSILEVTKIKRDDLFTGPDKMTDANQTGKLNLIGVTVADREQLSQSTFDFATVTFKAKKAGSTVIDRTGEYEIVGSRGETGDIDRTLELNSFASTTVTVSAGTAGDWPVLNFKIRLGGTTYKVNDQTIVINNLPEKKVTVVVKKGSFRKEFKDVPVSFDSQALGTGQVILRDVPTGDGYIVTVGVPGYLIRRFCSDQQTVRCLIGQEGISFKSGANNYDWSGLLLEPGDVNLDVVVNSIDFTKVKSALGKTGVGLPEDVVPNGVVNPQDLVKLLETLSNKYGEEI